MRLAGSLLLLSLCTPTVVFAQADNQDYEDALAAFHQQKYDEAYIHLKNVLQKNPENLTGKLLYARLLLETHNYSHAIDTFNECLALGADPNLVVIHLSYAYLFNREPDKIIHLADNWRLTPHNLLGWQKIKASALVNLKQYVKADELYKQLLLNSPNNVAVLNGYASLHLIRERVTEAKQLIELSKSIQLNNSTTWHLIGRVAQIEKQPEKALSSFEQGYQVNPDDPVIVRSLIGAYIKSEQIEKAKPLLAQVLQNTPDDPNALLLQISLLRAEKQFEQAQALETELLSKLSLLPQIQFDELPQLKLVSGIVSYGQGDYESTSKSLQNYLKDDPQNLTAISLMANTFIQLDQANAAMKLLSEHENLLIHDVNKANQLAELYLTQGAYHKADYWISLLIDTYPDNDTIKLLSAKLAMARGKPEQANLILTSIENNIETNTINPNLYTKAVLLLQNKAYQHSLELVEQLLQQSPDNIDYLSLKSGILIKLKQYQAAELLLKKILTVEPKNFAAQFNQASVLYETGENVQADTVLKQLLIQQPKHYQTNFLMALNLVRLQKTAIAIEKLESIILNNSTATDAINLLTDLHIQNQAYDKALNTINQLDKLKPLNYQVLVKKAKILLALNQTSEAKEQLRILVGMSLSSAFRQFEIAKLQVAAGDAEYAQKSFVRAIELDSNTLIYKLELARLYLNTRQLEKADKLIISLAKQYQKEENVRLLQADLKLAQQDFEAAFKLYKESVELNNGFLQPLFKLYQLASHHQYAAPFENFMQSLIQKDPNNLIKQKLMADFYLNHQQLEKAKYHYEFILNQNDDFQTVAILNNLAVIYMESDLNNALQKVEQALTLEPNNPYALDTKGWILVKQTKMTEGLQLLRNAHTINSANPSNLYHIGYALYQLERKQEAKTYLKQALALNQTFSEEELVRQLLNQ
ncbi:PEP-CTERM system TPR-repeat protein PrsT [Catenovulum sp. 2E275]|uniref:XrtA/PEP-CTERM system TPR-repeat protein PrsT n=1 Tax=Catenovulum sp. 2E275 TaxID=2980497 RepID=UPI0021D2DFA8|nr:XrtA/PEP-CTERM system TPR-repeat protein PrsT [Catenovulum sp. 2E275]MCU4674331.1 PEP-CTERM system TPR-repeat protein PrsT [Catenovulum sp. 2E275]